MSKRGTGRRDTVRTKRATMYAEREGRGRFTDMSEKGRSLARDRRTKARTKVGSGRGHRGDRAGRGKSA